MTTAREQVVQVSYLNLIFSSFISLILGGHNNKISNKCRWEWFHIKNTGSSKSIGRSDTVYFYRVFGCGYNKITANSDEYVKLFYSGLGPCEKWGIRLYLSYDQTIPPFYNWREQDSYIILFLIIESNGSWKFSADIDSLNRHYHFCMTLDLEKES